MYQGKFDKKRKQTTQDIHEITAARNAAAAEKKINASRPAAKTASEQDVLTRKNAARPQAAAAQKQAPAQKQPTRQAAPQRPAQPVRQAPQQQEPAKCRGPRLGGVIFYTLYFLCIFVFFVGVFYVMQGIQVWLTDYEAAQPTVKSEEAFHQLFDDPDWGFLYDASGIQDTTYESKDAFVAYMEEKVGDAKLTYQQTSAGLSDSKKYNVKMGDEKLASFTITPTGTAESNADGQQWLQPVVDVLNDVLGDVQAQNWEIGEVQLFFERAEGFRIQKQDNHTVYVNGIPLTEEHTIQYSTIVGEGGSFLPAGATVPRVAIQEVTGLMLKPTVTIFDENNKEMSVVYDEEQGMFIEQTEANTISEEEKDLALSALKVYAEYQIKEASSKQVAKYFDSNGEAYKGIMQTVLTWTKGNNGYSFANDSVTNYNRYSDSMFSVYATTEMTIKLTDGGTTTKPINATLLFTQKSGKWTVSDMTNMDIGVPVSKVRLTFMNNDGLVLSSEFVEAETTFLKTPLISIPEGKVFSGWVTETIGANGSKTLSLAFTPDENGDVTFPVGTVLKPMVLKPLFENASAAAAQTTEGA